MSSPLIQHPAQHHLSRVRPILLRDLPLYQLGNLTVKNPTQHLCIPEKAPRILPVRRSLPASYKENRPWPEVSFSLRNISVRAFDSQAHGWVQDPSGSSTIEPPSALAESGAYPPDRALPGSPRQYFLPFACSHLPKRTKLELGRGADLGNTILN